MLYNEDMAEIDIDLLIWEDWNRTHIWERHQLAQEEVEEVCYGDPERLKVEDTHNNRFRVIRPKHDGKLLVIILAPEGEGRYYVVTAKPPKRQELRRYQQWRAEKQA